METEWKQTVSDGGHSAPFRSEVEYNYCSDVLIYTFDPEEGCYVTLCNCDEHEPLPDGIAERDA